MGEQDLLPAEAAEILRQFPGPVMLRPTIFRSVATCVVCALLLAVFAYFTVVGVDQRDVIQAVGNGVCGLVSAYAGSTALYALLTRSSFMRLTAEGFEIQYARRFERHSWRDVAGFAVIPTGRGGSRVIYDDAAKTEARARTSRLVRTYGLEKEDMARLMNEWRRLALEVSR